MREDILGIQRLKIEKHVQSLNVSMVYSVWFRQICTMSRIFLHMVILLSFYVTIDWLMIVDLIVKVIRTALQNSKLFCDSLLPSRLCFKSVNFFCLVQITTDTNWANSKHFLNASPFIVIQQANGHLSFISDSKQIIQNG